MSKAKAPKRPRKASVMSLPPLRASSAGATPDEPEDEPESELVDEALLSFVMTPAAGADRLTVFALSPSGDAVIQDRQAIEAKRNPEPLAISIASACERYAATERRAVRFRAAWQRGDRTLATYNWEAGTNTKDRELDGSVQSFLLQQQQFAQAQHQLHLEGFEMVQESWKSLLSLSNKRIEALEKDNQELRDRLRKMDDVGSEIAIEQMRAEIETRGRTADLIEKRILPIAQAVALKMSNGASAAPVGHGKPEQGEHKQPAADA